MGAGVTLHPLSGGLGHETDPCDCDYHSGDRARLSTAIFSLNQSANLPSDLKISIIREAYYSPKPGEIRAHFLHCGFLGSEDPRNVVSRLVQDWNRKAAKKYQKYHKAALEQYLWYRKLAQRPILDRPQLMGPWWDTVREFRDKPVSSLK